MVKFVAVLALISAVAAQSGSFSCVSAVNTITAPAQTRTYVAGNNFGGQLGFAENNTLDLTATYIGSQTTTRNTHIVGGFMTSAAILAETTGGRVYLSGDGTTGALGFGPAHETASRRFFPPVDALPWLSPAGDALESFNQDIIDVCQGSGHTCVLVKGTTAATRGFQRVMCAGRNNNDQLATGPVPRNIFSRFAPVLGQPRDSRQIRQDAAFNATNFGSIHCGGDHTLAVSFDRQSLFGWGSNALGQLGQGTQTSVPYATSIVLKDRAAGDRILHVATGYAFSIVVLESGTVYVFGSNAEQQLGIGSTPARVLVPTIATGTFGELGTSIRAIYAGGHHVVMIAGASSAANTPQNRIFTWGDGTLGQTGHPVPEGRAGQRWSIGRPTAVPSLINVAVQSAAAGMKHSIVLDACNKVYSFGSDAFGQLMLGGSTAAQNFRRMEPTLVNRVSQWSLNVFKVAAGAFHSMVIASAN